MVVYTTIKIFFFIRMFNYIFMVLVFVFKLFVYFILNACVYCELFYVNTVTRKYGKMIETL